MHGEVHRRSHHTACTGPDHINVWEFNVGPARYCVGSNNSLQLGPYHLFNPGGAPEQGNRYLDKKTGHQKSNGIA